MGNTVYRESRRHILGGLFLLFVGSALLLACKLPIQEFAMTVLAFAGGGAILLGNGLVIFGLLVFADSRSRKESKDV